MILFEDVKYYISPEDFKKIIVKLWSIDYAGQYPIWDGIEAEDWMFDDALKNKDGDYVIVTLAHNGRETEFAHLLYPKEKYKDLIGVNFKVDWTKIDCTRVYADEDDAAKKIIEYETDIAQLKNSIEELVYQARLEDIDLDPLSADAANAVEQANKAIDFDKVREEMNKDLV